MLCRKWIETTNSKRMSALCLLVGRMSGVVALTGMHKVFGPLTVSLRFNFKRCGKAVLMEVFCWVETPFPTKAGDPTYMLGYPCAWVIECISLITIYLMMVAAVCYVVATLNTAWLLRRQPMVMLGRSYTSFREALTVFSNPVTLVMLGLLILVRCFFVKDWSYYEICWGFGFIMIGAVTDHAWGEGEEPEETANSRSTVALLLFLIPQFFAMCQTMYFFGLLPPDFEPLRVALESLGIVSVASCGGLDGAVVTAVGKTLRITADSADFAVTISQLLLSAGIGFIRLHWDGAFMSFDFGTEKAAAEAAQQLTELIARINSNPFHGLSPEQQLFVAQNKGTYSGFDALLKWKGTPALVNDGLLPPLHLTPGLVLWKFADYKWIFGGLGHSHIIMQVLGIFGRHWLSSLPDSMKMEVFEMLFDGHPWTSLIGFFSAWFVGTLLFGRAAALKKRYKISSYRGWVLPNQLPAGWVTRTINLVPRPLRQHPVAVNVYDMVGKVKAKKWIKKVIHFGPAITFGAVFGYVTWFSVAAGMPRAVLEAKSAFTVDAVYSKAYSPKADV